MSKHYYYYKHLDKKGNHEVHDEHCSYLPDVLNREYIGYVSDCESAIKRAKRDTGKNNFDGCFWCCRECHTG